MDVTIERIVPIEKAFQELRGATLEKADKEILYYQNATLRIAELHPNEINPSSLYLLEKNIAFQQELRKHLLHRYGVDTFQLSAVLHLRNEENVFGMAPPYVEISEEKLTLLPKPGDHLPPKEQTLRIPLLIDGIHRVWCAREANLPIRCIVAHGTHSEYLNYAYPNGWHEVKIYNAVPAEKKFYRRKVPYSFMIPLTVLRKTDEATPKMEHGRQ